MTLTMLRSKILRATVTDANCDYEGSLSVDSDFLRMIDMLPYEKILVGNITNGKRFETYAIPAESGSRMICLNGAAAHKGRAGDLLVFMSFAQMSEEQARIWQPRVLVLGDANRKIVNLRNGVQ